MATAAPMPGGYALHIPDPFHAAVAVNPPYSTTDNMDPTMDHAANADANRLTNALKARKRTKTGCLTCRKRRIKCGEERPTCKNCTKSKRECEGYLPRVVFKESPASHPGALHGPFYPQPYIATDAAAVFAAAPTASADGVSFQAIAPRPTFMGPSSAHGPGIPAGEYTWSTGPVQMPNGYAYTPQHADMNHPQATTYDSYTSYSAQPVYSSTSENLPNAYVPADPPVSYQPSPDSATQTMPPAQLSATSTTWPYSPASTVSHPAHPPSRTPGLGQVPLNDQFAAPAGYSAPLPSDAGDHAPGINSAQMQPFLNETAVGDRYLRPIPNPNMDYVQEQAQGTAPTHQVPTPALSQAQEPEDDWFDVESDDETTGAPTESSHAEFGTIIARNAQQGQGDFRSLTNFLDQPHVLSTYNPAYAASPLKDAKTARIFCHFITATGPTLHVCERHPCNPAVLFSGRPVPKSQQALWSYTLPMLALRNQGLLHAMLAMASLHMAKLQNSSATPSLRHYHYALRRVAKALGNPKKRTDPSTLAATLLLGYYEVTTAEHNKWNSHLSGARELISDTPYLKMAKRVDSYRQRQLDNQNLALATGRQPKAPAQIPRLLSDVPTFTDDRLDQRLISSIMGFDIRWSDHGMVLDNEGENHTAEPDPSARDVEEYETHLDLFWWYAKQDAYQSILSGNRLLLPYARWARCPPRGPVGKIDAVYGSMDHCYLLIARLADFAGKDLARKKRAAMEAEKAAKLARNSPPSSGKPSPGRPPPMYGMMPDPGPVRLPNGFSQEQHDQQYRASPPSDNQPLDEAYNNALVEWHSISQAFETFRTALGPGFEPLKAEHMTPCATPFGPAVYYRNYAIACLLHLYHTGRLILARTHPKMPPAAMAAALVSRKDTEVHTNAIGRICAGIWPVSNTAPLNPHHGAALMDVCMGLFHASVQFTDPAQRGWTITKLRDVARLTGWQTSSLIAAGCERAWIHYASLGVGPPYERTMNNVAKDDRVAGRSRDPEHLRSQPKDNNDRRFVKVNAGTRVYWAMGILSVEEDMRELNIDE